LLSLQIRFEKCDCPAPGTLLGFGVGFRGSAEGEARVMEVRVARLPGRSGEKRIAEHVPGARIVQVIDLVAEAVML
jgi:hypothetical protein